MLGGVLWGFELLLFGAALLPLGELIRSAIATRVPLFRSPDLIERGLLDFYLGGAALYGLALSPFPGFGRLAVAGLVAVGVAGLGVLLWTRRHAAPVRGLGRAFRNAPYLVALLASLSLLLFEGGLAALAPAGNTFDSSVLDLYTGLLLSHGHLTFSLLPVAAQSVATPQGTTALYAAGQVLLGTPPALTPLLLTPWFIALSPIAGYVVARRWGATPAAAATAAVGFALLGSWTRVLVSGSYDFVAAFPLVLLLLGWSADWARGSAAGAISWTNSVGFGFLVGLSAALNPVGAQLVFLGLPFWWLVARPPNWSGWVHGLARWAVSIGCALVMISPSLAVLWAGRGSQGLIPGAGPLYASGASGLGLPAAISALDPFLLGAADVRLSPFPLVRVELIALLLVGLFWLLIPLRSARASAAFARYRVGLLAALAGSLLLLGALWLGGLPGSPLAWVGFVTSSDQLGVLLFSVYTLVALAPVGQLVDQSTRSPQRGTRHPQEADSQPPEANGSGTSWTRSNRAAVLSGGLAVLLLLPGVAVSLTQLPAQLNSEYRSFGDVTPADLAAVSWMAGHLPDGGRILVAPGSAAEFVAAENPNLVLLLPMTPVAANASYTDLVLHLVHGNLSGSATSDLLTLQVQYVAVTAQNNRLWPAFSSAPLQSSPDFTLLYQNGDAWVFRGPG